jgi:cell division septum initiation protein DivIVA
MSAIINRADGRKTVRDASDDRAKTGTNGAAAPRKTAHDASEARGEAVRKDIAATSGAVIWKNAKAAEQTLQKATEDLRDTVERSAETVSDVVGASREMSQRADEQLDQMSALRDKAAQELASRTPGAMIQTGVKLADGFQAIMREWADYTRDAMQCNIDGLNSIMRARTPQDLMTAQRELMNAEVRVMLNSGVRISEATLRVASDAVQSIGGRTT